MSKFCIVYRCQNKEDQGKFVGDLCTPCYEHISNQPIAQRQYSQAWRNALETARMFDRDREDRVNKMIIELKGIML